MGHFFITLELSKSKVLAYEILWFLVGNTVGDNIYTSKQKDNASISQVCFYDRFARFQAMLC